MENRRNGPVSASRTFGRENSKSENKKNSHTRNYKRTGYGRASESSHNPIKNRETDTRGRRKFHSKERYPSRGSEKTDRKNEPPVRIVSEMQVTDGKHRGKYLTAPNSKKIRLTSRRIREVLFRILYRQVKAGRFLDLCAGAGMVGIDAISRGALICTMVERSAKLCSLIRENLKKCGISPSHGEVFEIEVLPFLKRMMKRKRFWDVVFYDPPYDTDYEDVLTVFEKGGVVRPGGILVIEHHSEMFFPENVGVMKRWKVVAQGESALSFYDRKF